jgi:hypothetical protein
MQINHRRKRLYLGGWFLVGILLLGLNTFKFMSLSMQPLVGPSPAVKMLQVKLNQLESILSGIRQNWQNNIDPRILFAKYSNQQSQTDRFIPEISTPQSTPVEKPDDLPKLVGILQILDAQGKLHHAAVLNGKTYSEKDRIGAYIIEKISTRGILLTQRGQQWHVPLPKIHFSKDLGS